MPRKLLLIFGCCLIAPIACSSGLTGQESEQVAGIDKEDRVVVRTAEELLKRIDDNKKPRPRFLGEKKMIDMPEAEVNKAVKILRERYPFKSIRNQMAFQGEHDVELPENMTKMSDQKRTVYRFGRAGALWELHSNEVASFIQREGQGLARMPLPTPFSLRSQSDYAKRIESFPIESELKAEPLVELKPAKNKKNNRDLRLYSKNGLPNKELVQHYHLIASTGFASPQSTGLVRSLDKVAGFESHRIRLNDKASGFARTITAKELPNDYAFLESQTDVLSQIEAKRLEPQKGIRWRTNRLQLVSLLMHDKPRVYESENLPNMEELSSADIETRNLSAFEMEALEKLKKGEDVVTKSTLNRIQMVGAVRANVSCLACHSGKDKELLGAFSYEFIRDPRLETKPAF